MIIALIIYFGINAILAVVLTLYKSRDILACHFWKLFSYTAIMLLFGLPIVVFGFLYVWTIGLIAKKHGDF